MLLRDLQEHLRRRFGLQAASRAGAASTQGGVVGRGAISAAHGRKQDFAPLIPPEIGTAAALAAYAEVQLPPEHPLYPGSNDGWRFGVWIRPGEGGLATVRRLFDAEGRTIPDDGRRRYFPSQHAWGDLPTMRSLGNSGLFWGRGAGRQSRYLCVFAHSATAPMWRGDQIYSEIWQVLHADGRVLDDGAGNVPPVRVKDFAVLDHELPAPDLTCPYAERFGMVAAECFSTVPSRQDPGWFTVLGPMTWPSGTDVVFKDWEYDLEGGTPEGQYDFRGAVENWTTVTCVGPFCSGTGPLRYPPPSLARALGRTVDGAFWFYLTGCYRWEPNPAYDPQDPRSAKYLVRAYRWVDEQNTPGGFAGAPAGTPMNPTWTTIDVNGKTDEQQRVTQLAHLWPEEMLLDGANFEAAVRVFWKSFQVLASFRYRYPCTLSVQRVGMSPDSQAGYIYQVEDRNMTAGGLRTMVGENVVYDDPPVETLNRSAEGPFPSNGGTITSPDQSPTGPGIGTNWEFFRHIAARPGGGFWVLRRQRFTFPDGETRLISQDRNLVLPADTWPFKLEYARVIRISEAGGKVWIVGVA